MNVSNEEEEEFDTSDDEMDSDDSSQDECDAEHSQGSSRSNPNKNARSFSRDENLTHKVAGSGNTTKNPGPPISREQFQQLVKENEDLLEGVIERQFLEKVEAILSRDQSSYRSRSRSNEKGRRSRRFKQIDSKTENHR